MLPIIIGGLCTAVSFAAGAFTAHAANESHRQKAKQYEKINTELINKRDALEKRYIELADRSKDHISELERKLLESEIEKDALYLLVRLYNSLVLLMQDIDRDPSFNALLDFWQATTQTNLVLTNMGEDLIPIPKDYFSRNLNRAKVKLVKSGGSITEEQKAIFHKILPAASDGVIICATCSGQNAVMKRVSSITCIGCGSVIDLITSQSQIQWNSVANPRLVSNNA